jgi:hypothetical protein
MLGWWGKSELSLPCGQLWDEPLFSMANDGCPTSNTKVNK